MLIRRLTSPTVKVRRLGYFAATCDLLEKQGQPEHLLPRILGRWAEEHRDSLEVYSQKLPVTRNGGESVVGEITLPERGEPIAACRYIDTAVELGLIVSIGGACQNTKVGHVLTVVPSLDNVFDLSMGRKFVLFRTILERDYLYLKTLIELIAGNKDTNDPDVFRDNLSGYLRLIQKRLVKPKEAQKVRDAIRKLKKWRSPRSYYRDHIRATRLEWLVDLGIVTRWHQRTKYIALRPGVSRFFIEPDLTIEWLNRNYAEAFHECFKEDLPNSKHWANLSEKSQQKLISEYMAKAMQTFRPSPKVDKISAWQFLTYAECSLLVEKGIIASETALEKALVSFTARSTRYRFVEMIRKEVDIGYVALRTART